MRCFVELKGSTLDKACPTKGGESASESERKEALAEKKSGCGTLSIGGTYRKAVKGGKANPFWAAREKGDRR